MKISANLILIVFSSLLIACHNYPVYHNSRVVFPTPFGYIVKGDSMRKVMAVLGEPAEISHYQRQEIWKYEIPEIGETFVYFEKGDVAKLHSSNNSSSDWDCKNCN